MDDQENISRQVNYINRWVCACVFLQHIIRLDVVSQELTYNLLTLTFNN